MTPQLRPLREAEDMQAATALLAAALPLDRAALVAREKLFGENGARAGSTVGAFEDGRLVGVLAQAGRFLKVLAVHPAARRKGIGGLLLGAARAHLRGAGGGRLRACDHPGNYLSPGVDTRYAEARPFFEKHGLREVARVQNLRAPLRDNPLVTPARAEALAAAAADHGYRLVRVSRGPLAEALGQVIAARFAPVWAFEVDRGLGQGAAEEGPAASGVHAALSPDGAPVAFAVHDGNNRGLGWFGPMGTLPEHRGKGLGEALLLRCLLDVTEAPEGGVIAWVGPVEFYRRAAGAAPDRHFVVYEES
jgi:GNAT superfamily N-acetyltransferase